MRVTSTLVCLVVCSGCGSSLVDSDAAANADAQAVSDGFSLADATPVAEFDLQFTDPDYGPFSGGTEVMVRGNGFAEGLEVLFGGRFVEPLDLEIVDSRRAIVRTPPGNPGAADVEVRLGSERALLAAAFDYEAITVEPGSGSVAGGTFVTITGFGTHFDAATVVTFDGLPLTGVTVVNEQMLTGTSPPGIAGSADVVVDTGVAVHEARRSYTYLITADPFAGGMGGGPINGTVNVVVIDANTKNGVDDAFVVIGDPQSSPLQGLADDLGQITFSSPGLEGPITVTAAAAGYETSVFSTFDAQDITIMLRRPPEPATGPLPPGPQVARIYGHVLFGDIVGIGSPTWGLVPEPRTPTEVKRLYVTTTAPNPFSSSYAPNGFIEYEGYDPDKTAWAFEIGARPSALAVVAIAGLYDEADDPSGTGVSGFEPFAMGVTRGVIVGPGENVMNVDVVVNLPLDTALQVELVDPPALDTPGWRGPIEYIIRPFLDFGGEGVIAMNKNGLAIPPEPEVRPNYYYFAEGAESLLLTGMAPLTGAVGDGSYGFIAGAYSESRSNPYSVRVARGYSEVGAPLLIDDFLGTPRPIDPAPSEVASDQAIRFAAEPPSTGAATFNVHLFSDAEGVSLLRIYSRGDVFDVDIPDLTGAGLAPFPALQDISWTFYRITVPNTTFDTFNYRQLSALYWSAYAVDSYWVQFPGD